MTGTELMSQNVREVRILGARGGQENEATSLT